MIGILLSPLGRIAIGLAAAFFVYKTVQYTGVTKERARIEKQDTRNVAKAETVARKSADRNARGVRDPHVRVD